jgi:hypothetical protein
LTKRVHTDGEMKPAPAALAALDEWLRDNGLYRSSLCAPLGTHQVQIARVFAGTGHLSATQRRAVETFTEGYLTVGMLEGKKKPPKKQVPPVQDKPEEHSHPLEAEGLESIDDFLKKFGGKLGVAAMKNLAKMMVSGKSESSRMQATRWALEIIHGKPVQHEEKDELEAPVEDVALVAMLRSIEARLMCWNIDEQGNRLADEFMDGAGI